MTDDAPTTTTSPSASPEPTAVWLYPGKTALGVVEAVIELEGDDVRVRTRKRVGKRTAEHVESLAQRPGLAERLTREDEVVVLELPRSSVTATFPKAGFGSALYLHVGDKRWRLALYPPQPQGLGPVALLTLPVLISAMAKGRRAGRPWREALGA